MRHLDLDFHLVRDQGVGGSIELPCFVRGAPDFLKDLRVSPRIRSYSVHLSVLKFYNGISNMHRASNFR